MSMGFGGWAHKQFEDEITVIFAYGGYNWNQPEYYNDEKICDGIISIAKNKMPDSDTRIADMLRSGNIEFVNCSHCWQQTNDMKIDIIILKLLYQIFHYYNTEQEFPDKISYFV